MKVTSVAKAFPIVTPAVFVTTISLAAANVLSVNVNAASPDTLIVVAPAAIKSVNVDAVVEDLIFNVL